MLLEDLQSKMNFYKMLSVQHRVSLLGGYQIIEKPETFSASSYLTHNSDFMLLEFPNMNRSIKNLKVLEVTFTSSEDYIKRKLTFAEQDPKEHQNLFDPETGSDVVRVNVKGLMLNKFTAEAREFVIKVKYYNDLDTVTTECVIPIPLFLNQRLRSCRGV